MEMRMEWRCFIGFTKCLIWSTMCALEIYANLADMVYTKSELKFESKDPLLVAFLAK